MFIVAAFGLLLACAAKIYEMKKSHSGGDPANYVSLFLFFQSIGDFISDIFFSVILFLEQEYNLLFWGSSFCTIVPYLFSCIGALYWMERWRNKQEQTDRLKNYLSKHESFFAIIVIGSGFYPAVDLLRSKVFYNNKFNLPLKQDEYFLLKNLKFLNIVLFENIPQFIIQIIYIITRSRDDSNGNSITPIVFLSMIFSVLSIILVLFSQSSRICQLCRPQESKFANKTIIESCLTIKSSLLKKQHGFANKKIETSLLDVLSHASYENNNDSIGEISISRRSDISFNIECFYIVSSIKTLDTIKAYFEITVFHNDASSKNIIFNNVKAMGNKQHANYTVLENVLTKMLKINIENGKETRRKLELSMSDAAMQTVNLQISGDQIQLGSISPTTENNDINFDVTHVINVKGENGTQTCTQQVSDTDSSNSIGPNGKGQVSGSTKIFG